MNNPLSEFFNSSSDASTLEATEQEKLEKAFDEWYNQRVQEDFQFVARPVMKHLNDNYSPHTHVLIDNTSAEIAEGVQAFSTEEYVKG